MDKDEKERLRKKAHDIDATVRVGKKGIEGVTDELDSQLGNSELVKVKFLRSAATGKDVDQLAQDLAEMTRGELVETRGKTAVYY